MGCVCCPIAAMCSSMLYSLERVSICCSCTMMVICILTMLVICCLMGVALGYHFCKTEILAEHEEPMIDPNSNRRSADSSPESGSGENMSLNDDQPEGYNESIESLSDRESDADIRKKRDRQSDPEIQNIKANRKFNTEKLQPNTRLDKGNLTSAPFLRRIMRAVGNDTNMLVLNLRDNILGSVGNHSLAFVARNLTQTM